MSKRIGFGVMTTANLLIEVFLGVRASLVYAFLYSFLAPPAWELWSLQALVILVVSATGFGVSLYRMVLVERIKAQGLPPEEEQTALQEARHKNGVLMWIIIANDIAGAVFPSLQAIVGIHWPEQWTLVPGAVLLAVGMSAFSFVPFYSSEITNALADLIPAERMQKMQQRTQMALLEQDASMSRINANAQARFEHAAHKLPAVQVLSVTMPYLTQKAQGDERLEATMQQMQEMMQLVTQNEARRERRRGKTRVEEEDEEDEDEEVQPRQVVKGRDYDTTGKIVAVRTPRQLPAAVSEQTLDIPAMDIAEMGGADTGPFVNGAQSDAPESQALIRLIERSEIAPSLLLRLVQSGQAERVLVRFVKGAKLSGRTPTAPEVPQRETPSLAKLGRLLRGEVAPHDLLIAIQSGHMEDLLREMIAQSGTDTPWRNGLPTMSNGSAVS